MSTVLVTAALLVCAVAVAVLAHGWRVLPPAGDAATTVPTVSVIVPARDEAAALPVLLRSLRRLRPGPDEVVVVDDGSGDATAEVARAEGARVLALDGPPAGWTGKAWACHRGAAHSHSDLLLFLDADTALAPGALHDLLAVHRQQPGLVSVQPFHRPQRAYEQLSVFFNLVSVLAASPGGSRSGRAPLAFGPCLLATRADYRAAGGHEAVRAEVLDDIRLAEAFLRVGLPVRTFLGGASIGMRMYPGGWRQLAAGWTKNIASGASSAAAGPTVVAALWVAALHAVAAGAVLAVVEAVSARATGLSLGPPAWAAVLYVAAALQVRLLTRRLGAFAWWAWAAFPVPLLGFDLLFAASAGSTWVRRSVRWRGRDVDLARPRPVSREVE